MRLVSTKDRGFEDALCELLSRGTTIEKDVEDSVEAILRDVKERGDLAIVEYTRRFDGVDIRGKIEVKKREFNRALKELSKDDVRVIEKTVERVYQFHSRQRLDSWFMTDEYGNLLGQRVTPIERAGIYVPGGKARYPSTVIMNGVPAKVAGVSELFMTTPPAEDGTIEPWVLVAAQVVGVDRVFRTGGVQAIAGLAYGTETIPKVDKIVGPGNIYVATAKKKVYGTVDIDMIAGPSEVLVINDGTGNARWMAMDLLSQAEHDELASAILITTSERMARRVIREVRTLLKGLERRDIAESSIKNYGLAIVVESLEEAVELSNRIAPEHLELFVEKPMALLGRIKNAGSIFLGKHTPEAFGDYVAGPNHTLPTGSTARFFSPLGVYDFLKFSGITLITPEGFNALAPLTERLARAEGLEAHRLSVAIRREEK
ncbi:MAG TPA: histidinol dehydrogenase [Deltaproteobacteria bacterium]|nr:histidinol dehydrogenase [Deltaproteobacteria bacterium]